MIFHLQKPLPAAVGLCSEIRQVNLDSVQATFGDDWRCIRLCLITPIQHARHTRVHHPLHISFRDTMVSLPYFCQRLGDSLMVQLRMNIGDNSKRIVLTSRILGRYGLSVFNTPVGIYVAFPLRNRNLSALYA